LEIRLKKRATMTPLEDQKDKDRCRRQQGEYSTKSKSLAAEKEKLELVIQTPLDNIKSSNVKLEGWPSKK